MAEFYRKLNWFSVSLGQPCESDINCKLIRKGTCSQNQICVCESNTFALDKMTCLPTLNTYCMFDECQIEFSHCHNNRCQCKPGYSEVSAYQCMRSKYNFYSATKLMKNLLMDFL